ncbi:MAG: cysteine synthase [Planctomycetes bacterium]|nr:cysteine synthase [Planctomycetota bacterium]
MDSVLAEILTIADELLRTEKESPRAPKIRAEDMALGFDLSLPATGKSEAEVLDLLRQVVKRTPKTSGRRFFNQLFAGRAPMATAGEMLASLLNSSMYTYKVGGPNILLEWELSKKMCSCAGFKDGDGTFLPGGSLANLVGMVLGRNRALPGFREKGAQGKRLTMYVSTNGHYSVRKNAGLIGIGRENCIDVAVDENGRMDPAALQRQIERDLKEGALPAVVIATSGTTVRGSFDSIPDLADICQKFGLWLHIDGAVGGTLLLHPQYRDFLTGSERADSLTWDAHKMMGIPLTCSALLVKDPEILFDSFKEVADYLFQADSDHLNPGNRSIQCGRRNDALKLWTAWQRLGDEGWAQRIEKQMSLSRYAAKRISQHPKLVLCEQPSFITVGFYVPGKSSAEICEQLHVSGEAVIGYGDYGEHQAIRLVTMNPEVSEAEIDALLEAAVATAAALPAAAVTST